MSSLCTLLLFLHYDGRYMVGCNAMSVKYRNNMVSEMWRENFYVKHLYNITH